MISFKFFFFHFSAEKKIPGVAELDAWISSDTCDEATKEMMLEEREKIIKEYKWNKKPKEIPVFVNVPPWIVLGGDEVNYF